MGNSQRLFIYQDKRQLPFYVIKKGNPFQAMLSKAAGRLIPDSTYAGCMIGRGDRGTKKPRFPRPHNHALGGNCQGHPPARTWTGRHPQKRTCPTIALLFLTLKYYAVCLKNIELLKRVFKNLCHFEPGYGPPHISPLSARKRETLKTPKDCSVKISESQVNAETCFSRQLIGSLVVGNALVPRNSLECYIDLFAQLIDLIFYQTVSGRFVFHLPSGQAPHPS